MEWIDITKHVPAFDQHVILCTKGGITTGCLLKIDKEGMHWHFNEQNLIYWVNKTVTHWQPLPPPPKN